MKTLALTLRLGATADIPIRIESDELQKEFTDPAVTFPLLDPSTGNPVGPTLTHGQVYATLWSLYMALAAERDAALTEEPPPADFRDRFGAD